MNSDYKSTALAPECRLIQDIYRCPILLGEVQSIASSQHQMALRIDARGFGQHVPWNHRGSLVRVEIWLDGPAQGTTVSTHHKA